MSVCLGLPEVALAAPFQPVEPDPVRVTVDAATDFPIDIGVHVGVELPYRLRINTTLGVMPGIYVGAINGFLVGIDAYDDATADLVTSTLSSSFVWRTHVGIRPVAGYGFYVDAGYGLVSLGGDASGTEIIAAATGQAPPSTDEAKSFDVGTTLHMVDVELGWELVLVDYLSLRFALGGAFTVGAASSVEPDFAPRSPKLTSRFTDFTETYLDDIFESYAFVPTASLGVGVSF